MNIGVLKNELLSKYLLYGDNKFYKSLLVLSLNKLVLIEGNNYKGILPNIELLYYYEQFIILFRREGIVHYLNMAKIFRRVAHKIYRIMLKKDIIEPNPKFLNLV